MSYTYKGIDRSAAMNRTGAFPLDEKSYFESSVSALAAARTAEAAGSTNTAYYFGQLVTVVEDGVVKTYKIVPTLSGEAVVGDLAQIDAEGVTYTGDSTPTISANVDGGVIKADLQLSSITPDYVDPT